MSYSIVLIVIEVWCLVASPSASILGVASSVFGLAHIVWVVAILSVVLLIHVVASSSILIASLVLSTLIVGLVDVFEQNAFLRVSSNQVLKRKMDLLGSDTQLDLSLIAIDVRAASEVALELASDDNDLLVDELVSLDPILVDGTSGSDVIGASLLLCDDVVSLDAYIFATLNKDAIGLTEELVTPQEQLVPHHVLDDAGLLVELA